MKKCRYTNEQLQLAVKDSLSNSGVCRLLGLSPKGGNLNTIKTKIIKLGLDNSHFTGQFWNKGLDYTAHRSIKRKDDCDVFIERSGWSAGSIKKRLFSGGHKQHICEVCRLSEWNGQKIPVELHHINGINNDNRIENLQILCPNCHYQTDNHGVKNINPDGYGVYKNIYK